ncbi:MAG: hypothetical protein J0H57_01130, partial [Rhodospirillales bacterium]|nr:hypothetical protein [Rhodospirillales bacterium]
RDRLRSLSEREREVMALATAGLMNKQIAYELGLSGIDLHDRLTAAGDRPPIVFITAFSQEKVRQRAGQDTVILGKPFAAEALADCLSRFAPH